MVGTTFPYLKWYPKPGQAKAVQIDIDPTRIGLRYPVEVGLVGDAKATLQALLPLLQPKKDRSFLEKAQKGMKEWNELMADARDARRHADEAAGGRRGTSTSCSRDDAIVTTDSGTITTWAARHIHIAAGHDVLVLRQPGHHGAGPALCHRRPGGLSRSPGRRLRRRRRLHDADGRVRHGGQVRAADQGRHHQEQHPRARSSGSRWSSWAIPSTRSSCSRSTS